jgi:hypothetical protein
MALAGRQVSECQAEISGLNSCDQAELSAYMPSLYSLGQLMSTVRLWWKIYIYN